MQGPMDARTASSQGGVMSNGCMMSLVIKTIENVDEMSKNQNIEKKDCLMRIHEDLCHMMQILISEPYRTSFSMPLPVELAVDDFIIQYTERDMENRLNENYEEHKRSSCRQDDAV